MHNPQRPLELCNFSASFRIWIWRFSSGFSVLINALLSRICLEHETSACEHRDTHPGQCILMGRLSRSTRHIYERRQIAISNYKLNSPLHIHLLTHSNTFQNFYRLICEYILHLKFSFPPVAAIFFRKNCRWLSLQGLMGNSWYSLGRKSGTELTSCRGTILGGNRHSPLLPKVTGHPTPSQERAKPRGRAQI